MHIVLAVEPTHFVLITATTTMINAAIYFWKLEFFSGGVLIFAVSEKCLMSGQKICVVRRRR